MRPFLGYHFHHTAVRIDPRKAFAKTALAMRTFSDRPEPAKAGITLDMANEYDAFLDRACGTICETFGAIDNTISGSAVNGGAAYRAYQWFLKPARIHEAFDLADRVQKEIPQARKRIGVQAQWQFKFRDNLTGEILPNQDSLPVTDVRLPAGSSLSLNAGHKASATVWLLFPFDSPSEQFLGYARAFQDEMIFKFIPKRWRIWRTSKSGEWRQRRIAISLVGQSACPGF